MTEDDFKLNMDAAGILRRLSSEPGEVIFWTGYIRGLQRYFHGEKFGSAEEHALWMAAHESFHKSRKMIGLGYRAGFIGKNIHRAKASVHDHGDYGNITDAELLSLI